MQCRSFNISQKLLLERVATLNLKYFRLLGIYIYVKKCKLQYILSRKLFLEIHIFKIIKIWNLFHLQIVISNTWNKIDYAILSMKYYF